MINPFKEVNWNPKRAERRQFARSLIIGFPILALVWLFLGRAFSGTWMIQPASWVAGVGASVGVILWLVPTIAKPFYLLWYGIACSIGMVISNVLLITFYLTIVTGFGILRRTLGRPAVVKQVNQSATSYWRDAEKVSDPKRYYSQF